MKRQLLLALTTLSLLIMLPAASTFAQSGMLLKVNIPFEFSVQDRLLPAGEYTVTRGPLGMLIIRGVGRHSTMIFGAFHTQASRIREDSTLVFNQYGNQYFLSRIWSGGTENGEEVFKSRAEKRLIAARRASVRGATRQTVSVVAVPLTAPTQKEIK